METPESLTPDEQQAMQNELNGRCRDCRWWEDYRMLGHVGNMSGLCQLSSSNSELPTLATVPQEMEGNSLYTSPDFACCQWKAKEVR